MDMHLLTKSKHELAAIPQSFPVRFFKRKNWPDKQSFSATRLMRSELLPPDDTAVSAELHARGCLGTLRCRFYTFGGKH